MSRQHLQRKHLVLFFRLTTKNPSFAAEISFRNLGVNWVILAWCPWHCTHQHLEVHLITRHGQVTIIEPIKVSIQVPIVKSIAVPIKAIVIEAVTVEAVTSVGTVEPIGPISLSIEIVAIAIEVLPLAQLALPRQSRAQSVVIIAYGVTGQDVALGDAVPGRRLLGIRQEVALAPKVIVVVVVV